MPRRARVSLVVCFSAGLALAACSSSAKTATKSVTVNAGKPAVTTTTETNAIGLKVNADEKAEAKPDVPLTAAQQKALDAQLAVATKTALQYPTVADITKAGYILAGQFTPGAGGTTSRRGVRRRRSWAIRVRSIRPSLSRTSTRAPPPRRRWSA